MPSTVLTEVPRDGVALVTIDRPDVRNALDVATLRRVEEAMLAFDADLAIGCIVLTGEARRAETGSMLGELTPRPAAETFARFLSGDDPR